MPRGLVPLTLLGPCVALVTVFVIELGRGLASRVEEGRVFVD